MLAPVPSKQDRNLAIMDNKMGRLDCCHFLTVSPFSHTILTLLSIPVTLMALQLV